RRTDLLLEFPARPLEVDFRLAQRGLAFVEEPRLVAHQLLALLDLPLPLVDAVHDGPELIFPPHEIGFPFFELAERLLTRLQLVPKRGDPTPERGLAGLQFLLLHPEDVPIRPLPAAET